MRKFWTILLLLVILSPAYALLRVGTVYFYPPFVMSNQIGFDIQFIHLLCKQINETCVFTPMNYARLFDSISSGKIDIAIGGITIGAGGPTKYIYSLPYVLSKGQFMVAKNSTYTDINQLINKRVGLIRGSQDGGVFYNYLINNFPNKFEVVQYDDIEDMVTALSDGNITAVFTHESSVIYWTNNGGGEFKALGKPRIVGNGVGIMALPKNMLLMQKIDVQIRNITQSNAYLNIYNTYFGAEQ